MRTATVGLVGVMAAVTVVSAGEEAPRQWLGALDLRRAVTIKSEHVAVDARELEAAGVAPGAFTPPKRVKGEAPLFPESAARAGAQGLVRLECLIKDSGDVEACRVIQSVFPAIDRAAAGAYTPLEVRAGAHRERAQEHRGSVRDDLQAPMTSQPSINEARSMSELCRLFRW